ncbi:hypothetical protein R6Q57_007392 [Mikania cordata]
MASIIPEKSQPLHNFSLPHLKWKNHRSGRSRLAGESSSSSPPHRSPSSLWRESPPPTSHAHIHHPPHLPHLQSSPYVSQRQSPLHKQSPMRDLESESEQTPTVPNGKTSRKISEQSTKPVNSTNGKRSNKICIRFRKTGNIKHDAAVVEENHSSKPEANVVPSSAAEEEGSSPKIWNLRPRRTPMNHKLSTGCLQKIGSSPLPEIRTSHGSIPTKQSSEVKNHDHSNPTTLKKHKFSIALSRDEIEEDIFSLTGSKPSRRPKKRPRTVQKQLDALFPGLWLGSITIDSYKVSLQG